ncbi:MAG: penicillin-binding protein 2 [Leptospirales bacterium]|nr:penicillin-binding protein 2 [Leptospirales bacterium]
MSRSLYEWRLERKFQIRLYILTAVVFAVILSLLIQLGNLQLVQGAENRRRARQFVSRQEFTVAPRGLMFDRNYKPGDEPLVQNIRFKDFVVYPARFASREEGERFLKSFCSVMGRDYAEFARYLQPAAWRSLVRKNESIILLTRMTRREEERLADLHLGNQGEFLVKHMRYYTMGPALAHVSGYIGLPSATQLDQGLALSYQTLGKDGIEARYDSELRGTDGVRLRHRIIDAEEQVAYTEQGNTLILTIDRNVQAAGYRALINGGLRGAAVAIRPATGEIVALISQPSYDPNILSSGNSEQRARHLEEVRDHEGFLNLVTQAKFPPASTFKPLVALAALEASPRHDVTRSTSYSCYGHFTLHSSMPGIPDTNFNCWQAGHGTNDLVGAIAQSCNVYFYNLGYHIGARPIIQYARAFGFDRKTEIDLPGEVEGRVPDARWKQLHMSSRWYDGDTVNLAIGQGYLETTPMELALFYSALANRGKMYRPHLVREVRDPVDDGVLRRFQPQLLAETPVSLDSLATVQEGLRAVVSRGSARHMMAIPVPIAGKTGTAQTRSRTRGRNHAWFAGFAPYGAPPEEQLVIVVFVEYGMGGGAMAAPVAGEMFRAAFRDYIPPRAGSAALELGSPPAGAAASAPSGAGPTAPLPAPQVEQ